MTAAETRREKARMRQAVSRARRRARRIAEAEAEAARREHEAEGLVPAVRRRPVIDGFGHMIVGARVIVERGGIAHANPIASRGDPLAEMARKSGQITTAMRRAGEQFQADWRLVGAGVGPAVAPLDRASSGGRAEGGSQAVIDQIAARARLEGALAHAGGFTPLLCRVLGDCVPLSAWAAEARLPPAEAVSWAVAALGRLSLFYMAPGEAP